MSPPLNLLSVLAGNIRGYRGWLRHSIGDGVLYARIFLFTFFFTKLMYTNSHKHLKEGKLVFVSNTDHSEDQLWQRIFFVWSRKRILCQPGGWIYLPNSYQSCCQNLWYFVVCPISIEMYFSLPPLALPSGHEDTSIGKILFLFTSLLWG